MWKAYYRGQRVRLFRLLVEANHEQARVGWPRALIAAFWLAWAAAGFARATGDYERFEAPIARGYRTLGLPADVDAIEVARRELRWWAVRREIGLSSGEAAGQAIAALYSAIYHVPESLVAEAGRLRGQAAEVRDRGAAAETDDGARTGRRSTGSFGSRTGASTRRSRDTPSTSPPGLARPPDSDGSRSRRLRSWRSSS